MLKENITRILGIVLIVFSMVMHERFGASVFFVVIAGLIMLIYGRKFSQRQFAVFISSLRNLDKKYFLISLYDIGFIAVFFLALPFFSRVFMSRIQNVSGINGMVSVLVMLFAYLIAVTLVLLLAYSLSRGLIWSAILREKLTASFLKSFFLLNLCWWLLLAVPALIVLGSRPEYLLYFAAVISIAYVHFTSVMHYFFIKNNRIGSAIKKSFALTFSRIKGLLLPYAYMTLVYFVLLQVFWIVPQKEKYLMFASVLFVVFYMAWYRLYLAQVLKRIE